MSTYEDKKAARIARYEQYAENAEQRSQAEYERSNKYVEHIPPGQPVLVGHYSEQRHRHALKKSWAAMDRSVAESQKAKYWASRAAAAEANTAIDSDDPEAEAKLTARIAELEELQEQMKAINKLCQSKRLTEEEKVAALTEQGLPETRIQALLHPAYTFEQRGFQGWALANNSANIRQYKKRLAQVQSRRAKPTTEREINGVRLVENIEDNRVQLFFPDIPSETVRDFLKHNGFHFSRDNGNAWQRKYSEWAVRLAEQAAKL